MSIPDPFAVKVNFTSVTFVTGDITKQADIDAVVNAANSQLKGGSGVCGAIFRAAGWDHLQSACYKYWPKDYAETRCPTGEARLTPAFRLPNKAIIHAVGPIYNPEELYEGQNKAELRGAYISSLNIALQQGFTSIAFPAISCGIYHYPLPEAADVALQACLDWASEHSDPQCPLTEIRFVFLDFADGPELKEAFKEAGLRNIGRR